MRFVLATGLVALLTTAASYFLRSDGYGLPGVRDGVVRIGFPLLVAERGGFATRNVFNPVAFAADLAVSGLFAGVALRLSQSRRKGGAGSPGWPPTRV